MDKGERFIELIYRNKIKKQVLPNTAPDYTLYREDKDTKLFRYYANSSRWDDFFGFKVREYDGDEQA